MDAFASAARTAGWPAGPPDRRPTYVPTEKEGLTASGTRRRRWRWCRCPFLVQHGAALKLTPRSPSSRRDSGQGGALDAGREEGAGDHARGWPG